MGTYTEGDAYRAILLYTTDDGVTWTPDPGGGNIAESPDGTLWRITVSDAGVVGAEVVV